MLTATNTVLRFGGGLCAAVLIAQSCNAEERAGVSMPSGLVVEPLETRLEPFGAPTHSVQTVRLRYVSDQLTEKAFDFAQIEGDFAYLCQTDGLVTRARSAPNAKQIIISIASEPLVFGEISPQIVQYFDAFDVKSDACVWAGL